MSLKDLTLQELIDKAIENAPDNVDKRTGSIIYDVIASVAVPLLSMALEISKIDEATFIDTAYDEYLDLRVAEKGLTRYPATKAIKKARFKNDKGLAIDIPIGSVFMSIDREDNLTYSIIEKTNTDGEYLIECDIEGSIGNLYYGELVPVSYGLDDLTSAEIIADYQEARDIETDDELRERYLDIFRRNAFGGNISQYDEELKKFDGVGDVQIYRAFPGPGHITISVVGPGYRKISNDLINALQEAIDPTVNNQQGTGLGIAPIFHVVHITTPIEQLIPISFDIQIESGYSVEQLRPMIMENIEVYFTQLRKEWGVLKETTHDYSLAIYASRIIVAVINVAGVTNVSNIEIGGRLGDYTLTESGTQQVLPILGEVTLNG